MKEKLKQSKIVLWWMGLITGIIMFFMIVAQSVLPSISIPYELLIAYPLIFIIFVLIKDIVRRTDGESDIKLGQIFIIMWWGLLMAIIIINFALDCVGITQWRLDISHELFITFLEVIVVYAISEASKKQFFAKQTKIT